MARRPWAKVLAALDPETRTLAAKEILASEWVPLRNQVALYAAIDRVLGKGDFNLCFEIGRFTCDHEMTTINRIFLKFGEPGPVDAPGRRHVEPLLQRRAAGGRRGVHQTEGTIVIREFNPISKRSATTSRAGCTAPPRSAAAVTSP